MPFTNDAIFGAPGDRAYLFANNGDGNFSPMRGTAVLKQKYALPGAKLHFAAANWDCLACAGQGHADVRWHVIAAFRAVSEVISIFRNQTIEKFLQVVSRRRIGIFHNDHAATSMLGKDGYGSISHAAPVDLRLRFVRDFVQSFSIRANLNSIMMNMHKFSGRKYHVVK
jgi:hypothetical protein